MRKIEKIKKILNQGRDVRISLNSLDKVIMGYTKKDLTGFTIDKYMNPCKIPITKVNIANIKILSKI